MTRNFKNIITAYFLKAHDITDLATIKARENKISFLQPEKWQMCNLSFRNIESYCC